MSEDLHHDHERLVELVNVQSDVEASIIKSLLETAGIGCVLISQVPHNIYPFTIDGLGEIRIKVLDKDLDAAREMVEDYRNSRLNAEEEVVEDPPSQD